MDMNTAVKRFLVILALVSLFGLVFDLAFKMMEKLSPTDLAISYASILGAVSGAYWLAVHLIKE